MAVLTIMIVFVSLVTCPSAFLLQNKLGLKNLTGAPSLSRVATIIAMDMRLPENHADRNARVALINKHTEGTNVFLCTDKEAADLADGFEHVVLQRFVEKIPDLETDYLIQWWRLKDCYEALARYATERHHEYAFIFKTRLDVDVNLRVVDIAKRSLDVTDGNAAFALSDYVFGGPPSAMSILAKLFGEWENYKGLCPYTLGEMQVMFASDWSAARFEGLTFPMKAVANICRLSVTFLDDGPPWRETNLKSLLMENANSFSQHKGLCSNVFNIGEGQYGGPENTTAHVFCSERAFVRHSLRHGVILKEIRGLKVAFLQDRVQKDVKVERSVFEQNRVNQMVILNRDYCRGRGK